ncbi:MAG: hypothetical protein HKN80_09740, partial [Acidimicrobiia bacterium]|nr:hypothetical protein [Acidimicrobiia bacterium]
MRQPSSARRLVRLLHVVVAVVVVATGFPVLLADPAQALPGATTPAVAVHVSNDTRTGWPHNGTGTGFPYDVLPESLRQALGSDGTPYVEVLDADIAGTGDPTRTLLDGGTPRYPIVISLANEDLAPGVVSAMNAYVAAGGFLFIGGSGLTEFESEVGLTATTGSYQKANQLRKEAGQENHRLVAHIPDGLLWWRMPDGREETNIVPNSSWEHRVFPTTVPDTDPATVIARSFDDGTSRGPIIATQADPSGGQYIFYGAFSPLIDHGSFHSGMYSYMIIRNAIEWAFEAADLPIFKRSTWQYDYDAAFLVRHDFESD